MESIPDQITSVSVRLATTTEREACLRIILGRAETLAQQARDAIEKGDYAHASLLHAAGMELLNVIKTIRDRYKGE